MAPNDEKRKQKTMRTSVDYEPTYQRFVLKQKSYNQQYSHIYVSRLLLLRDAVVRKIEESNVQGTILSKVIDLREGDDNCIIVGTILKELKAKPSVFDSLTSDQGFTGMDWSDNMASSEDSLMLEDESGRVQLVGEIDPLQLVTGVVLGVRGQMLANKHGFYVKEMFTAGLAPQRPLPVREQSTYVALVSGLHIGQDVSIVSEGTSPLATHLLMDYLAGRIGDAKEREFVAQIARTIVIGSSVVGAKQNSIQETMEAKGKKKSIQQLELEAMPLKNLDQLLSTLACCMSVDVMPGAHDPSNFALPQQAFHSCLFPQSARFKSFRAVTNPYEAQIGGVKFLGSSGQPVQSILQCVQLRDAKDNENQEPADTEQPAELAESSTESTSKNSIRTPIDCLEHSLQWRHLAPTAPDMLACFPIAREDPFVVEESPHVFFTGNAPAFETRMVQGSNNQQVRLVVVPSFAQSQTIVLVDLKDLSCFPICISL